MSRAQQVEVRRSSATVGMWSCSQEMSTGPWWSPARRRAGCPSPARSPGAGCPSGRRVAAACHDPQRRWPGPALVRGSARHSRAHHLRCDAVGMVPCVVRTVSLPFSSATAGTAVWRVRDEDLGCQVGLGLLALREALSRRSAAPQSRLRSEGVGLVNAATGRVLRWDALGVRRG